MARFEVSSAPFSSTLPVEERVTLFLRAVDQGAHLQGGLPEREVAPGSQEVLDVHVIPLSLLQ